MATRIEKVVRTFIYKVEHRVPDWNDRRIETVTSAIAKLIGTDSVDFVFGKPSSFGIASAMLDGTRVLKLTSDEDEVRASAVVEGKTLAHVVHIHGAYFVKGAFLSRSPVHRKPHKTRIGVIIAERVSTAGISETAKRGLGNYVAYVKDVNRVWPPELLAAGKREARERLDAASAMLIQKLTSASGTLAQMGDAESTRLASHVALALEELRRLGIFGVDFHSGNVGWTLPGGLPPQEPQSSAYASEATHEQVFQRFSGDWYWRQQDGSDWFGPFADRSEAEAAASTVGRASQLGGERYRGIDFLVYRLPHGWFYRVMPRGAPQGSFGSRDAAVMYARAAIDGMSGAAPVRPAPAPVPAPAPAPPPSVLHEMYREQEIIVRRDSSDTNWYAWIPAHLGGPATMKLPVGYATQGIALSAARSRVDALIKPDEYEETYRDQKYVLRHAGVQWYVLVPGTAGGSAHVLHGPFSYRGIAVEAARARIDELLARPSQQPPPEEHTQVYRGETYVVRKEAGQWFAVLPEVKGGPPLSRIGPFATRSNAEAQAQRVIDLALEVSLKHEAFKIDEYDVELERDKQGQWHAWATGPNGYRARMYDCPCDTREKALHYVRTHIEHDREMRAKAEKEREEEAKREAARKEQIGERIYKIFDIGVSSAPPRAKPPLNVDASGKLAPPEKRARKPKALPEGGVIPIAPEGVVVKEI